MQTHPRPTASAPSSSAYNRLTLALRSVLSERSPDRVLTRIVADLRHLVECDDVVIWELVADQTLVAAAVDGDNSEVLRALRIKVGEGITGAAVAEQQLIVANSAHQDPRAAQVPGTPNDPEAILCIPLSARNNRLGALAVYRVGETNPFTPAEAELAASFAHIAAISIDNARTLASLEELAATDDLTGLANRRHFHQQLAREIETANSCRSPLTILLVDIDDFKATNDAYGHARGDEVLREIAGAIRSSIRPSDTAARVGGDEFAIILSRTTAHQARGLANRIASTIEAVGGHAVSTGIASYTGDVAALLRDADQHLYAAKHEQKTRVGGPAARADTPQRRWRRALRAATALD